MRDALGRITLHTEYQGAQVVFSRSASYNAASQVMYDSVTQLAGGKTTTTGTSYRYTAQMQVLVDEGDPEFGIPPTYETVDVPGSYANGAVVSQSSSTSENKTGASGTVYLLPRRNPERPEPAHVAIAVPCVGAVGYGAG